MNTRDSRIAWGAVGVLVGIVIAVVMSGCQPGPLWQTDFEGDVRVLDPRTESGQWRGLIGGSDWPELPGEVIGFQPMVSGGKALEMYVDERVVSVPGRDGTITRALAQTVLSDDPTFRGISRSNYLFRPDERMREAYQEMWLFLQPNLGRVMSPEPDGFAYNWRQVWEVKHRESSPGVPSFRSNVWIAFTPVLGLHWRTEGQYRSIGGRGDREWYVTDASIEVPVGEWFRFGVYLKQDPEAGRFVVQIGERTLIDHSGPTMVEGYYAEKWNLVKVYTDPEKMGGAHWQFVDDIRILGDVGGMP